MYVYIYIRLCMYLFYLYIIYTKVVIKKQIEYILLLANICILMVGCLSLYIIYPSQDSAGITLKDSIKFL